MSKNLVSDFVETALSPSFSIHSIFTHTALLQTFIYLPMLTKFKRYLVSAQWFLCVLLNWLKLNKRSFNLHHFTVNLRYQLSSCFSFMINLYLVCVDFFRMAVEFWLVLLGPFTGKVLDSWCLFLISENKICLLDVYFIIQDRKHNHTSAVYSINDTTPTPPHPPWCPINQKKVPALFKKERIILNFSYPTSIPFNYVRRWIVRYLECFCLIGQVYNYWLDLNNNKLSTREEGATEDNKYRGKTYRTGDFKGQRLIDVKSRGQRWHFKVKFRNITSNDNTW